jgi:hypothetical protein
MQVLEYPTLYNADSYELAAFSVFDQTFNVLGNGLDWQNFFKDLSQPVPDNLEDEALKYISGKQLYYGCNNPIELSNSTLAPNYETKKVRAVKEDQYLYPDVKLWYECSSRPDGKCVPYPNFAKQFSFVYTIKFKQLSLDWIEAAEWFYNKCMDYFNTDCSDYAYAFPNTSTYEHNNMIKHIVEMMHAYPTPEEQFKCFELPYYNDPEEFLTRKWQRDLELIKESIREILSYLHEQKNPIH